jgi:hypothetical protein
VANGAFRFTIRSGKAYCNLSGNIVSQHGRKRDSKSFPWMMKLDRMLAMGTSSDRRISRCSLIDAIVNAQVRIALMSK